MVSIGVKLLLLLVMAEMFWKLSGGVKAEM